MYREPRSLGVAQRIVTWAWGACSAVRRSPPDPAVEDQRMVATAATTLETSEFELFAIAYRAWYGSAPVTRELEREFGGFLLQRRDLPFYVRRFISRIHILAA